MKTSIAVILLLFYLSYVNAQESSRPTFIIHGEITGRDTGVIYLSYLNENYQSIKDTVRIKESKFTCSGMIAEPCFASLLGNSETTSSENKNFTTFCLEKGIINIALKEDNFSQVKISGSKTQKEWESLQNKQKEITRRFDSLEKISYPNKYSLDEVFRYEISQSEIEFIQQNPGSYLSPYFLRRYVQDLSSDSSKQLYDSLEPKIKNSQIGKILYTQIHGEHLIVNKGNAPSFTRKSLNGKITSLDSFKGKKIVILDFWASWCIPCRKENQYLKQLLKKYNTDNLEIISISIDDNKSDWLRAISEDGIYDFSNIKSEADNSINDVEQTTENISVQYAVTPIPVQILIDKDGKIAGRFESGIDEISKKIDEILK